MQGVWAALSGVLSGQIAAPSNTPVPPADALPRTLRCCNDERAAEPGCAAPPSRRRSAADHGASISALPHETFKSLPDAPPRIAAPYLIPRRFTGLPASLGDPPAAP